MASIAAVEGAEALAPEAAEVGSEAVKGVEEAGSKVEGEAKTVGSKIKGLFSKDAATEEAASEEAASEETATKAATDAPTKKPGIFSRLGDVLFGYTVGQAVTQHDDTKQQELQEQQAQEQQELEQQQQHGSGEYDLSNFVVTTSDYIGGAGASFATKIGYAVLIFLVIVLVAFIAYKTMVGKRTDTAPFWLGVSSIVVGVGAIIHLAKNI